MAAPKTGWVPEPPPSRRPVQPSDFERAFIGSIRDGWLYYRCPHCGQRDGPFRNMAHVERVLKTTPRLCFYATCPGGN